MTKQTSFTALCSVVPFGESEGAPEWVHLLPAGSARTVDGRGPYRVVSLQSICAASMQGGKKLPIDEAHATDKGAASGQPHPARGWIVEMEPRADGIWGRVDWNNSGKALMDDRAYAGISPVILHDKAGNVHQVLRASLTNTPNLQGLTALQSEEIGMDWNAKLIELLGLDSNADDAAIMAALKAKLDGMQSAEQSQKLDLTHPTIVALQSQITDLANTNKTLVDGNARRDAVAIVDAGIAAGRVGLKPLREEYISLHMAEPAKAVKMIEGLPILTGTTLTGGALPDNVSTAATGDLGTVDHQVMSLFGVEEEAYKADLAKGGKRVEVL